MADKLDIKDIDNKIKTIEKSFIFFNEKLKDDENDIHLLLGQVFSLKDLYSLFLIKLEYNNYDNLKDTNFFDKKPSEEELIKTIEAMKLQTINFFEHIINVHPNYALTYYHLGYLYLNDGKYNKASLCFRDFLVKVNDDEEFNSGENASNMITEIVEILEKIKGPCDVESAIQYLENNLPNFNIFKEIDNKTDLKKIDEKKIVLENYLDNEQFKNYWPLKQELAHVYYYEEKFDEAIKLLEECLKIKPLLIDSLALMIMIYSKLGDKENLDKYANKYKIVTEEFSDNKI